MLRITCDDGADNIRIVDDSRSVHLIFDGGEPQMFTGVHAIDAQTQGGRDTLDVMFAADGVVTSLLANLGNGDDAADIAIGDQSADSHYSVDVGEGDNHTRLRFGDGQHGRRLPTGSTNVTARYRSGAGKDDVTYDWLVHLDRPLLLGFDALTGAGDDNVKVNVKHEFAFQPSTTDLEFLIHAGTGDDDVHAMISAADHVVGESTGAVKARLLGDGGDDLLRLMAVVPKTVKADLLADGGEGSDHGIVTSNVQALNIERLVLVGKSPSKNVPAEVEQLRAPPTTPHLQRTPSSLSVMWGLSFAFPSTSSARMGAGLDGWWPTRTISAI